MKEGLLVLFDARMPAQRAVLVFFEALGDVAHLAPPQLLQGDGGVAQAFVLLPVAPEQAQPGRESLRVQAVAPDALAISVDFFKRSRLRKGADGTARPIRPVQPLVGLFQIRNFVARDRQSTLALALSLLFSLFSLLLVFSLLLAARLLTSSGGRLVFFNEKIFFFFLVIGMVLIVIVQFEFILAAAVKIIIMHGQEFSLCARSP
jgi:hypothetical protein